MDNDQQLAVFDPQEKNPGGRPPYEPTEKARAQVKVMAGVGLPQDMMATILGISADTLRKYFEAEMAEGKAIATFEVAKTLYHRATKLGEPWAVVFWLKSQAGWTEKIDVNHRHSGNVALNLSTASTAELQAELDALERRERQAAAAETGTGPTALDQEMPEGSGGMVH